MATSGPAQAGSGEEQSPNESGRKVRGSLPIVVLLALAIAGIQLSRDALAGRYGRLKETSDVYALPPPEQLLVLTLGYRAAIADLIYAHVLVGYGLHFQERRRFEYVGQYLDAVTTLDPKFAQPYLYADTLLTLQPKPPLQADYRKARELLLKGTRELPFHQRLWFTAGQYLAYLAPPHIIDEQEREQLRTEGAKILSRACELATDNAAIPHHCLAAAGLLNRAGEREALIQMLTRTLAVNDDEQLRMRALAALRKWVGEQQEENYSRRLEAFQKEWRSDLPYVSKEQLLLMGPNVPVNECVGVSGIERAECRATWRDWARDFAAE